MGTPAAAGIGVAGRRSTRVHRAWLVAAVTFLVLLASAAFRSSLGVLLVPIEEDLGWTRTQTSFAVSLNLVVYGLAAPFAAALLERVGVRRTAVGASVLTSASSPASSGGAFSRIASSRSSSPVSDWLTSSCRSRAIRARSSSCASRAALEARRRSASSRSSMRTNA